jgi:hypothetical protein
VHEAASGKVLMTIGASSATNEPCTAAISDRDQFPAAGC